MSKTHFRVEGGLTTSLYVVSGIDLLIELLARKPKCRTFALRLIFNYKLSQQKDLWTQAP